LKPDEAKRFKPQFDMSASVPEVKIKKVSRSAMKEKKVPFEYDSDSFYEVVMKRAQDGWSMTLQRRRRPKIFKKRSTDTIIEPFKGNTEIFLAFVDGEEAGHLQIEHQRWNNSLRVWDIGVEWKYRRMGVGSALMGKCKERAQKLGARRIILETQTSNANAIDFYLSQGFELVGMDLTNYTNEDVGRNEVRVEMAYHLRTGPTKSSNANGKQRSRHRESRAKR